MKTVLVKSNSSKNKSKLDRQDKKNHYNLRKLRRNKKQIWSV